MQYGEQTTKYDERKIDTNVEEKNEKKEGRKVRRGKS